MEREKCEFDICNHPLHMFLCDNHENPKRDSNKIASGWVSYRYVICRAMWYNIKENNSTDDKIRETLSDFKMHFEKKELYKDNKFFHIRCFTDGDDLLIIDKTHGCYPLLLNKERFHEFKGALEEVDHKIDKILSILRDSQDEWTFALEERLRKDLPWDIPKSN